MIAGAAIRDELTNAPPTLRTRPPVRYLTAAALVNELVDAADDKTLSPTSTPYDQLDLLCCGPVQSH